ncbi:hypothetical protein [Anaerosalibacter sp. Marseille-P3206]|uniref:hypothetical protein n=1 Tax=Anaerosalibacter sp. Marseille-P3206 TaxID=1871005 RepID=UPI000987BA6A|nr:hypothetical protein [Anaerosalibacter sp. Marseille-P3206]
MFETIEYCTRAVIRYLNGDMDLFKSYTRKAMKIYEQEKCIAAIGEMIPTTTKQKLYEMVS